MKQLYTLLWLIMLLAAPAAGVAQHKGTTPDPAASSDTIAKICDTVYYWHGLKCTQSCDTTDNGVTLHLSLYPPLEISITPLADTTFCGSGVLAVSDVNPNYSYVWNNDSTDTLIVVESSGTYSVVATLSDSTGAPVCSKSDSISITVNQPTYVTYDTSICESEVPYTWIDGIAYNESNYTATVTFTNSVGCDSVVTLHLTVNPTYTMTDAKTICESELPYTWNSIIFNAAGDTTVTLQTVNGCDSVVTMTLIVNPTYTMTDAKTICESELPYIWNSITFDAAGDTTVTLQTINGCDSVVTMTLSVNPIYNDTTAVAICASELPYTWNGVTFTEAGTQTTTLQTVNGCDSIVTMTLAVNPTYAVTDVQAICESELPYSWNGVSFDAAGTQTATLQTVNGCDSVVTMTLTVNPTFNTTNSVEICQGTVYPFFNDMLNQPGVYTHTLQSVNGCDSVIVLNLTVYPTHYSSLAETICEGETYFFFGNTLSQPGDYSYVLQGVHGCDSIVTLHLTINDTMVTKEIVRKKHANGETYMLVYPDTGLLYQWYRDGAVIDTDGNKQYYAPKGGLLPGACYQVRVASHLGACGAITEPWCNNTSKYSKLRILPNPNDGQFRLILPEDVVSVQILNVNGQVVMMRKVEGDEVLEMNTGLANGLYFVKTFRADGSFNTEKLVIYR